MLNKKRLSAKGITFALLALGGLGVASHNSQAHASSIKPSVSYAHHGRAKANTRQMNFLAHPKTHKVATSQRTPRIVTARGMVKPNKIAKTAIRTKLNRVNKPRKQNVNKVRKTVKPAKVVNKVTTTKSATRKSNKAPKKLVGFTKGLSQHALNKQGAQKQNYNNFVQQRKSDRSGVKWNTRDLGNYRVKDGHIKPHMIYRSSRLTSMSPAQIKKLQKMGVTKIIDLRQRTDRMNHLDTDEQDRSIPGTKIKYEIAPVFTRAQRKQMGKIGNFYKGPAVDSARAKKSYRKVFHTLLTNKGATLFHCDSGQDRTGVVSALVMSSLGANRNEVTNDYLLSNAYRRHPQNVKTQKAQINNFYKVINHQYGNMNNYLHKGLGLTNRQIKRLRNRYVRKNGANKPTIIKSTRKAVPLKAVKTTSVTPKSASAISQSAISQAPKSASVSATNTSTASNSSTSNKNYIPILDVLGPQSQSSSVAPKSVASSAPQSVQSTAPVKMIKANPIKKIARKPTKKQISNVYHVNGKYSISKNTWRAYQLPKSIRRYVVSPKHVGMHYGSHKGWSDPGIWSVNFANSYFHKIWNTKNGTAYGNGNSLNRGWHRTMKGYITNKAHVGALGSSTNRALTGGNQFGHSFVVQHVFKNGYSLVVEENWPKMTGYRGGNNDRWNYAVIPSQMKGTTYFMPKGYHLNMGNKVHKTTKKAMVKLNTIKSSATKSTANKPATQSASSSTSKSSSTSNLVPTDNITRVLNNVTKNVQQQSQANHSNNTQTKPVVKLSNLRKNKVASNKASHSNREVTYMYQNGSNVVQGRATMAQINANKKLPKNTAIIDNSPKTIKTNLSESYKTALKNINSYRRANGLKPLQISHKLNKLATIRATQLESHWGHYYKGVPLENDDARKLGMYKTNDDAGYHLSENIAESPLSPNELMPSDPKIYNTENGSKLVTADDDAMYNYDGHEGNWSHRTNMLNPYATKIGIGTRYNAKTGMYYVAEDFYQPKTLTSNQQYNNYVNSAMKSLSKKDYTESDKLACQQAGKSAKNKVLANHGSKEQANRAYKSAFIKQMKTEIKK